MCDKAIEDQRRRNKNSALGGGDAGLHKPTAHSAATTPAASKASKAGEQAASASEATTTARTTFRGTHLAVRAISTMKSSIRSMKSLKNVRKGLSLRYHIMQLEKAFQTGLRNFKESRLKE